MMRLLFFKIFTIIQIQLHTKPCIVVSTIESERELQFSDLRFLGFKRLFIVCITVYRGGTYNGVVGKDTKNLTYYLWYRVFCFGMCECVCALYGMQSDRVQNSFVPVRSIHSIRI